MQVVSRHLQLDNTINIKVQSHFKLLKSQCDTSHFHVESIQDDTLLFI